jgi:thiopeptide-type bacteriocin biosynthesis protein
VDAQPSRHTTILTRHLPALLTGWGDGEPGCWWFLPYRQPSDHLRFRFRLPDTTEYGPAATRFGSWVAQLRAAGIAGRLRLDTYYPDETGRFGPGASMTAAQGVFTADSQAAIAQRFATTGDVAPLAVAAASFVDLAGAFTGDYTTGAQWLIEHIPTGGPGPARALHRQAVRLAAPSGAPLGGLPGGAQIEAAWARRRAAIGAYRVTLDEAGWPDPDGVLRTLLHLHSVRAHGIDRDAENTTHGLARAAALSWLRRRTP